MNSAQVQYQDKEDITLPLGILSPLALTRGLCCHFNVIQIAAGLAASFLLQTAVLSLIIFTLLGTFLHIRGGHLINFRRPSGPPGAYFAAKRHAVYAPTISPRYHQHRLSQLDLLGNRVPRAAFSRRSFTLRFSSQPARSCPVLPSPYPPYPSPPASFAAAPSSWL